MLVLLKRREEKRRGLIPDSDTEEKGPNDWFEVLRT